MFLGNSADFPQNGDIDLATRFRRYHVDDVTHDLGVRTLKRLAALLQDALPEMTIRAFLVLLTVAEEDDQTVSHYAAKTGFPIQTTSRILQDLSGRARSGQKVERAALLEGRRNVNNQREVNYKLSPIGRALVNQMRLELDRYTA